MERLRRGKLLPPIVLAATPELATTALVPVRFDREKHKELLGTVEFENVLGQTVTRVFNDERATAGARLGTDDLDTILVGVRARNFQVDGRAVIDPLGLSGKRITAILELTFAVRTLFEQWQNFFNADHGFFFTTETYATASTLERTGTKPAVVLSIGELQSYCAYLGTLRNVPFLSGGPVSWSHTSLRQAVAERWRVGGTATADILGKYAAQTMSSHVRADLNVAIRHSFSELTRELSRHRVRGTVFVQSETPLPVELPYRVGPITLQHMGLEQILEPLGFTLSETRIGTVDMMDYLAPFLEFYYDTSNSRVNHWLRRRVHWFTPTRETDGRSPV